MSQRVIGLTARWREMGWGVLVLVLCTSFVYESTPLNDQVLCVFRRFTGWSCPGCGLTRSFCAMARGEFIAASSFHLAGPMLFGAMVWLVVMGALRHLRCTSKWHARHFLPRRWVEIYWWVFAGLYSGQAVRVVATWRIEGDIVAGLL